MTARTIYKLTTSAEWALALQEGEYHGSRDDKRDGFIHFSSAAQLAGTARKHFSGVTSLLVLTVDVDALATEVNASHPNPLPQGGDETASLLPGGEGQDDGSSPLRWEPSRDGDLFPHLYGALPVDAVTCVAALDLAADGTPIIPTGL
jgi:uncharacterized protein (DUF952 family)